MSQLQPEERRRAGQRLQTEVLGGDSPEPRTLFESSWRDYVFSEVWSRPGLDRRARILITLAGATCSHASERQLEAYVRGALKLQELTLVELREAALHMAVYSGWSRAERLDEAISRAADQLGLEEEPWQPLRAEAWDPQQRLAEGQASFEDTMVFPGPPPSSAFIEAGVLNFVFAELWNRPGLDQRSRRWLTLVGVSESGAETPVNTHLHAALASGNVTQDELYEFILQYAIHCGWPRAAVMQRAAVKIIHQQLQS